MELDRVTPSSEDGENWITNRIILCRPCGGWKSNDCTLAGLRKRNEREGWMRDDAEARAGSGAAEGQTECARHWPKRWAVVCLD